MGTVRMVMMGVFAAGCFAAPLAAQEVAPADSARLAEWQAMRFGMFIHWGPVSLKGTEIGWSRGDKVPAAEYDQLYTRFNPVDFDAKAWAALAKDTGMKYVIITSKHHDGFCIWDSALTDYDIMSTPFKRDILRELSDACRAEGLAFSTYHSILDWYQPDYNTINAQGGPGYALPAGQAPSMDRYQEHLQNQLREIVTKYGPLQSMWFDGEWETPWTKERGWQLLRFCRELDPKMLVNNRVGKGREGMEGVTKTGFAPGDYDTPEQQVGAFNIERPWETCMTICTQWAWKPDDKLKSLKECLDILVQTVCGGGNLLLNVGPMPDGRIEPRQAERLREIGAWMKKYGDTLYNTGGGPYRNGEWGGSTHRDNKVWIHVLQWKKDTLKLKPIPEKVLSSRVLTGGEAKVEQTDKGIDISMPKSQRDPLDTIVELTLEQPVTAVVAGAPLR